jgi:hypothetical protein
MFQLEGLFMHKLLSIAGSLCLAMIVGACSRTTPEPAQSAAKPAANTPVASAPAPVVAPKVEVLPEDGGEIGKLYAELNGAYAAGDKDRAAKLLAPPQNDLSNYTGTDLKQFSSSDWKAAGGRRYGDHATLFLIKDDVYWVINAIRGADGWRFASLYSFDTEIIPRDANKHDCSEMRFPCGIATAPDSQVSGTVQTHRENPNSNVISNVLFDGFAVRMLDAKTHALRFTRILLTGTGINPRGIEQTVGLDGMTWNRRTPAVLLDVKADGKTALLAFIDQDSAPTLNDLPFVELNDGFSIDNSGTPNRIRGHLKTDIKDVAAFDVNFDLSSASQCGAAKCRE